MFQNLENLTLGLCCRKTSQFLLNRRLKLEQNPVNSLGKAPLDRSGAPEDLESMGSFSITHLLLLLVIFLLFFGPSKLPSLGQSLGKAIRGFKEGLTGDDEKERPVGPEKTERLAQHQETRSEQAQDEKTKEPQKQDS